MIGQGSPWQARAFREHHKLADEIVLLCDPGLRSYAALGWYRHWWRLLHPMVFLRAVRLVWLGYRQGPLQGDPLQNGGVIMTDAAGNIVYRFRALWPGHHPRRHGAGFFM